MNPKKSINAKDFIQTSKQFYKQHHTIHLPENFRHNNQNLNRSNQSNNVQNVFLEQIRKTHKLRRGLWMQNHSSLSHSDKEDNNKDLMISSRRYKNGELNEEVSDFNRYQQSINLDEHKFQHINKFRRKKLTKNFIQSEIKEFQINLKENQLGSKQFYHHLKSIEKDGDDKLSPYQMNIRKKKINKVRLKMNSLDTIYTSDANQQNGEQQNPNTNIRHQFAIVNNKIAQVYRKKQKKSELILNHSPISKSINLTPLSQGEKRYPLKLKNKPKSNQANKSIV